jgi:cellobiose phosphorylase
MQNTDFDVKYINMIYEFINNKGTFTVKNPHKYNAYFPLTNKNGSILSAINSNLGGDIKKDNTHFLTPPATIEDARNNLLCRRDFFIKTDKETIRASFPRQTDTLEAGLLYHKITKKTRTFNIEILNFIPYDLDVEIMWVKVTNKSKKTQKIIPTSFIPLYGRGEKDLRDHRHVSSLLNRVYLNKYGLTLKPTMVFNEEGHTINDTIYFSFGFENNTIPPIGQFPTLDSFYGEGDLISPCAIEKDITPAVTKRPEFDGKESCAAFRFKEKILNPKEETNYFIILGIDKNEKKINETFKKLNSLEKISQKLKDTKEYWQTYFSKIDFDFKDPSFNNWLLWVKTQPTLRKLFGCSFLPHFDYGKGGRGWRDLWQDALTLMLTEPDKAKKLIMDNFRGVRIDGSNATIISKNGSFISDRNRISRVWMDHGIWPYLTLRLYLNRSGDINFLLKETSYFKDHLLSRAKEIDSNFSQKDYLLRNTKGRIYTGSVLEHILLQNIIPFFNVGNHNVIRLENADWNDGLDMAAENGESAAFSFMYAHNLKDVCLFLEKLKEKTKTITVLEELSLLLDRKNKPINYNNPKEKQSRLQTYFNKTKNISGKKTALDLDDLIEDLKEKSNHLSNWLIKKEWLSAGFFNGYYDNKGRRVEGISKKAKKMMLASSVFAIMSGCLNKKYIDKLWFSIKKHLKDKRTGGFRLNTDFKSLYIDLGRAFGFSYGDKENGAFFNHMAIMLAHSLYKENFVKEGNEVISSIYKMAVNPQAKIYPMIPEYFNNEAAGLYLYLTGSASWYTYTLLHEILGIKFTMGNLLLEPKLLPSNFFKTSIASSFTLGNKKITVCFKNKSTKYKRLNISSVSLGKDKIPHTDTQCIIKKKLIERIKGKEVTITVSLE